MGLVRDISFVAVLVIAVMVLTIKFGPNPTGYVVFENDVSYFIQDENLAKTKATYNENLDKIPSFIKTIIDNEKVNIVLDDNNDGLTKLKLETKDDQIISFEKGTFDEPSLIIYSDLKTLQEIKESEKIVSAIEEALDNEKIVYESIDWSTKIKTGTAGFFVNVWSWFD
ncbi:hypothetical protein HYY69_05710 [Candidatus Woesearchaeota archaeon]|nr:hypothetical protein [Candidatus Woesearchaeota archaeon]